MIEGWNNRGQIIGVVNHIGVKKRETSKSFFENFDDFEFSRA